MSDTGRRGLDGSGPLYRDGSKGKRVKPVTDLAVGDVFLFDGEQYTVAERPVNTWGIVEVPVEERGLVFEFTDMDTFEIVKEGP